MEKMSAFLRRNGYLLAGVALMAIVFSACKKDNNNYVRTPAANLMAFNLATDQDRVGITLSGNNLTNVPLGYTSYTGSYLPVYVGSREVKSYDFGQDTLLATSTQVFADSAYYTLFIVGSKNNHRNVLVNDSLNSLVATSGQAFVRYINAVPDSSSTPLVTIGVNGTNVVSSSTPFATVSGFTKVASGNIIIGINNGTTVSASRTIAVDDGKVYTVLLTGDPAATDSTKNVQIKFIQNGTVTP